MQTKKYSVSGMTCSACAVSVERAVKKVEGVSQVSVNLLSNSMVVTKSDNVKDSAIFDAVKGAGYNIVTPNDQSDSSSKNELKKILVRLIVSICFLLPLSYISMGYVMFSFPLPKPFTDYPFVIVLLELVLATIILVINNNFFIKGTKALLHGSPNMDTLIAVGSSASFIYSLILLFSMAIDVTNGNQIVISSLFFEASAMIPVLITVGKTLESYSKGKTANALKSLIALKPQYATVIDNGVERVILAKELKVGDVFIVKPGESIPCDAVIIEGESSVDQSAITGESLPVDKVVGDNVTSATINLLGSLTCRATKVGAQTTIAQIIELVEKAQSSKAPIAKIADKVAGIFVPVVMGISLIVLIIWLCCGFSIGFSLSRAISVLVISCPCALGLATPVAIVVGSGISAKKGILFKNATALENTGKVDVVVFDKTGTLTNGTPSVTDVISLNQNELELLELAYGLETKSEHPLAKAVCNYCKEMYLTPASFMDFKAVLGRGVKGSFEGVTYYGGNLAFIKENGLDVGLVENKVNQLSAQGKTPLVFASNDGILGIIALRDQLKPDSVKAINDLKQMGIKTVMLTGDNLLVANALAKECDIDQVYADLLPTQKAQIIKDLTLVGKVCMVGDGINDAPALTLADVGIAVGSGTDVAIDSADVVLLKSTLKDVVTSIKVSAKVTKNIKQNLFWAFFYNSVGIPIAAGALYPLGILLNPMIAAAAMSLSSVCVVLNSLRLNLINFDKPLKTKKHTIYLPQVKPSETIGEKVVKIDGMMCKHCQTKVTLALENLKDVQSVTVDLESKTATLTLNRQIDDQQIIKAVEDAGFKVVDIK